VQVHERHFGGPLPKKKKKAHDHRTFCLYSARILHKLRFPLWHAHHVRTRIR
jgi:hypothetical protein